MQTPTIIVDTLNGLIENSQDNALDFERAAEHIHADGVRQVFLARAEDYRRATLVFQSLVAQYGETPTVGGSLAGALSRGWMA